MAVWKNFCWISEGTLNFEVAYAEENLLALISSLPLHTQLWYNSPMIYALLEGQATSSFSSKKKLSITLSKLNRYVFGPVDLAADVPFIMSSIRSGNGEKIEKTISIGLKLHWNWKYSFQILKFPFWKILYFQLILF